MHEVLTLTDLRAMTPDAAAAWLVYRQAEGAGPLDTALLADWLELDPAHLEAWRQANGAWSDFEGAADDEILAALRADARAAGPEQPKWRFSAAVAAAVLVVAVGAMIGVAVQGPQGPAKTPPIAAGSQAPVPYANSQAGPLSFQLADGTRMTLRAGSQAQVALSASQRDVRLVSGRAFFDVAHDTRRPFSVHVADQKVVALGTRFDVQLRPGELQVVLVEGRVSVRAAQVAGAAILLEPGQQLVIREGAKPVVSPADLDEVARWQARYVVFENVTLSEAAAQLNRLGAKQLLVRDPEVGALRITGRFRVGDMEGFGQSLSLLHPVHVVQHGPNQWELVEGR
ncbi:FecR family protein [Phenylobacterium koreense]|uniref:Transmembrane sensor n=1 Tax=Phenylobacterium koreense TaxID=266125 RepID=A0ABV2EPE4_9CAUL